ncbi:hypothetical protein [Candidatus Phytoplasma sp. AldY-WA1]|nr:hypothetical protein [Candidatus Phytoplasma sp. AldY-WA1]
MARKHRGFGNFCTYWLLPVIAISIPVVWYLATQGYLQILYTPAK